MESGPSCTYVRLKKMVTGSYSAGPIKLKITRPLTPSRIFFFCILSQSDLDTLRYEPERVGDLSGVLPPLDGRDEVIHFNFLVVRDGLEVLVDGLTHEAVGRRLEQGVQS